MSITGLINFEIFIFFTNKIIFEDSIFSLHWGIFYNNNNNNKSKISTFLKINKLASCGSCQGNRVVVWAKLSISKVGTSRNLQPPFFFSPTFIWLNIAKKEIIIIIILKVPKKKIFLRFSVPRIQPKFKKNHHIFIHGSQVGSQKYKKDVFIKKIL